MPTGSSTTQTRKRLQDYALTHSNRVAWYWFDPASIKHTHHGPGVPETYHCDIAGRLAVEWLRAFNDQHTGVFVDFYLPDARPMAKASMIKILNALRRERDLIDRHLIAEALEAALDVTV